MITIRDIERRVLSGKVVDEKEFDMKILPTAVRDLVQRYQIRYDRDEFIVLDPSIPDKVFKAALDLLAEVGLYCAATGRTVTYNHGEVLEFLATRPTSITFGQGKDAVTIESRKVGDTKRYLHTTGCGGTVISEQYYIPTQQAMALEGDAIWAGILRHVGGLETKAGMPSEILAAMTEATYMREAARRAGKPGMPLCGVHSVSTPQGALAAFFPEGYRIGGIDWISTPYTVEMRLDINHLSRSLWMQELGIHPKPCGGSIFGGIPGPIEATAICAVAHFIGVIIASNAPFGEIWVTDRFGGCTRRECLWARSVILQAMKRNTGMLVHSSGATCAGACTDTCLYESAAFMIVVVASGSDSTWAPVALGGFLDDCQTPLEMRFGREVAVATQGWDLRKLNDLVAKMVAKYEGSVDYKTHEPRGKLLPECYDIATMTPSEEWWGIYLRVKDELEEMGVIWPSYSREKRGSL